MRLTNVCSSYALGICRAFDDCSFKPPAGAGCGGKQPTGGRPTTCGRPSHWLERRPQWIGPLEVKKLENPGGVALKYAGQ